jgi:formamidase
MHAIRIDRGKRLCDEPNCGHNRYHPDITPVVEISPGEEIALETRDGVDGQITPAPQPPILLDSIPARCIL